MAEGSARDTQPRGAPRNGMVTGRLLRNAWYAAAWAEEVAPGKVLGRKILGEPVALFRSDDGRPAAVEDRCPHRFAALSAGRVVGGDKLQCIYHGLELDASGACTRNPHPPANIPTRARVKSYPLVERHKALWIWMGNGVADPARIPDFSVLDTATAPFAMPLDRIMITANYELIVDNLLDLSHTAFVHEGILGNADIVDSAISVEQDGDDVVVDRFANNAEIPGMSALQWPGHPDRVDKLTRIRWMAPSTLNLLVGVSEIGTPCETGVGYHAIHILTPETDRTTHYFFTGVRFGSRTGDATLDVEISRKVTETRRFAFVEQDAPIIEAQQRIIDEAAVPLEPITLSVDAGPVRYKRVLERLLAAES
jgi:phenylpropionate dioxygenase-like ring-hydroxylating dioxygenase large terminal subunit